MIDPAPEERSPEWRQHPDSAEEIAGADGDAVNWPTVLVLGLIGTLVLVVLVLHLAGVVGPTGHG